MAEKYSKWADKAGVNPFFPSKVAIPSTFVSKWVMYATASSVAAPRLLLVFAVVLTVLLFLSLLSVRSVVSVFMLLGLTAYRGTGSAVGAASGGGVLGGLGVDNALLLGGAAVMFLVMAFLRTRIKQLGIKVALLTLGVNFHFQHANLRRLGLAATKDEDSKRNGDKILPGDVVVCNLTNPLEIVALESFLHNPVFVFPLQVNESGGATCLQLNFSGAFFRVFLSVMSCAAADRSGLSLLDICSEAKNANRCVVLFAEGVRTNGDGVLRFASELFATLVSKESDDKKNIHIVGFQYPSPEKEFSPAHPVGSFLKRICWIASYNPFRPFYVRAEFVLASSLRLTIGSGCTARQVDAFVAEIRDILSNLLKKNKVDMGFDDYTSFCEYHRLLSSGKVEEASAVADKRKKH